MKYDILKHINSLELEKVLSLLSNHASMKDTKEKCHGLLPSFSANKVGELLKQTDDAYKLIAKFGAPSFGRAENVNSKLSSALAGSTLSMGSLLSIGELFRVIRGVKEWHDNNKGFSSALDCFFEVLMPNKYFEDKIFFAIKSEDEMSDNASEKLSRIRRTLRNSSLNIKERLDKIVKNPKQSQYLQDAIVTMRQGRYVVPVKAEYKAQIPGLLHDTSASGATLFIEPMSVVEINNEIKELQAAEKNEIERILSELSGEAAQFAESAMRSYDALVEIDLCFAKAKLAYAMKASVPELNCDGIIMLKNARHPLIDMKKAVPITLEIGTAYRALIITGPNTGGKTVAMKTVGLLTLMAYCGLMIPAGDNSRIAVFDGVFADIGDEQSIEQSLSTFSSHMNNIISILGAAGDNSLVLFDELCSGTDPIEGSALSIAILTELIKRKSTVIATTHYPELKTFAMENKDTENACCEFDIETLKPTYKLLIGIPGRSNAFEISKKLGLDESLVEAASNFVSGEYKEFDDVVKKLEEAKVQAEKEKVEINILKSEILKQKKEIADLNANLQKRKEKIIESARKEANDIIEYSRNASNSLLGEIEDIKKKLNKENSSFSAEKARRLAKSAIEKMEVKTDSAKENEEFSEAESSAPISVGDSVRVKGFAKPGIVEQINEKEGYVFVVLGSLRTKVERQNVALIKSPKSNKPKTRNVSGLKSKMQREVKRELDIRGFASDEGIMEVDRFIDEAVLSGTSTVIIIHGKGTGVLKKAVRAHLKNHPSVATYRPGVFGEGEDGVTVAEIK